MFVQARSTAARLVGVAMRSLVPWRRMKTPAALELGGASLPQRHHYLPCCSGRVRSVFLALPLGEGGAAAGEGGRGTGGDGGCGGCSLPTVPLPLRALERL